LRLAEQLIDGRPEAVRTYLLWQEHDPIFPLAWSDRLDEYFTDLRFQQLTGAGHFTPLEATDTFAAAIRERLAVPA
jgi:pimeloyl-ACP methyl ester carboxylesterase